MLLQCISIARSSSCVIPLSSTTLIAAFNIGRGTTALREFNGLRDALLLPLLSVCPLTPLMIKPLSRVARWSFVRRFIGSKKGRRTLKCSILFCQSVLSVGRLFLFDLCPIFHRKMSQISAGEETLLLNSLCRARAPPPAPVLFKILICFDKLMAFLDQPPR